jgi:hypothetical protein
MPTPSPIRRPPQTLQIHLSPKSRLEHRTKHLSLPLRPPSVGKGPPVPSGKKLGEKKRGILAEKPGILAAHSNQATAAALIRLLIEYFQRFVCN